MNLKQIWQLPDVSIDPSSEGMWDMEGAPPRARTSHPILQAHPTPLWNCWWMCSLKQAKPANPLKPFSSHPSSRITRTSTFMEFDELAGSSERRPSSYVFFEFEPQNVWICGPEEEKTDSPIQKIPITSNHPKQNQESDCSKQYPTTWEWFKTNFCRARNTHRMGYPEISLGVGCGSQINEPIKPVANRTGHAFFQVATRKLLMLSPSFLVPSKSKE